MQFIILGSKIVKNISVLKEQNIVLESVTEIIEELGVYLPSNRNISLTLYLSGKFLLSKVT